MKSIAIIGMGTAGLQALCHLVAWLPREWKIISIHTPTIPSIKIGESTTPPFVNALFYGINFNSYDDLHKIEATLKIGTVFKKWRPHNFIAPLPGGSVALHINSFKVQEFVIPRLKKRWGSKIEFINKKVNELTSLPYDYIVDCRGFPKDFKNYYLPKEMLINHALIHNIPKRGDWNYTGHRATKNGWMFEIPLPNRQSYGYMYCDKITSTQEAKKDFAREIEIPEKDLDKIEYTFIPCYAKELFDGRIFKNGNRAMFFEPLSANSLFAYDTINKLIIDHIKYESIDKKEVNQRFRKKAEQIRDLIYFFYHGGSTYTTKFWSKVSKGASQTLNKSEGFKQAKRNFKYYNKIGMSGEATPWGLGEAPIMYHLDKTMGYNYF